MTGQSTPGSPNHLRGHIRTVVLGVVAVGLLGAGIWRHLGPRAVAAPQGSQSPVPQAGAWPAFEDVTVAAGIDFVHVTGGRGEHWIPEEMGPGAALLDFDGDEDLDLYLVQGGSVIDPQSGSRNRLLRNDGGTFVDVSSGSGADLDGYGFGAAAADYDNDGDVDLYVGRLGRDALLRNDGGGRFTEVAAEAGVDTPGFSTVIVFFDFDLDGRLDLFVGRYIDWAPHREVACFDPAGHRDFCNPLTYAAPARDVLYRNRGDGTFEDVSTASGVGIIAGHSLGASPGDFDGDGRIDLYVACDQTPSLLWMNQGGGVFEEQATLRGCAFNADGVAIAGMGVATEDLDGDGDDDLIVTNIHDQPHLGLRNDSGFFEDSSHAWGLGGWGVPYTAFGIAVFDQDHDGLFDGVIANGGVNRHLQPLIPGRPYDEPNQFVRRGPDGRFRDASNEVQAALASAGVSRAAVAGDYDNDGDIDVVVTNNGGPTRLLRNHAPTERAWIQLDLVPAGGGRHALNARVELHASGAVQRREVRPHSGFLGSGDPRVHFGLGAARSVERVVVRWPRGNTEQWQDLPVRAVVKLIEGTSPALQSTPGGTD